jgi:hypothetical protein
LKHLNIIGLDSAWLCGSDSDQGKIVLTEEQLESHIREGESLLDGFRIALVHHPLDHLADHHAVRRLLGDGGADILLHGHQHMPLAMVADEPGARLRILASGCLIEGDLGKAWPNGFNLLEVDTTDGSGAVHFRKWARDARFWAKGSDIYRDAPDGTLKFGFSTGSGGYVTLCENALSPISVPNIELDWPHATVSRDVLQASLAEAAYRRTRGDSPCCHVSLLSLNAADKELKEIDSKPEQSNWSRKRRVDLLRSIDYLHTKRKLVEQAIEFLVDDEERKKAGWWLVPNDDYSVVVEEMLTDRKQLPIHAIVANNQDEISSWIYFSRADLETILERKIADKDYLSITDLPVPKDVCDLDMHTQYRVLGLILRKLIERNMVPSENIAHIQKRKWLLYGD